MKAVACRSNYINDQDSFSEMYELHSGKLFGLILKWVKEYKIAEMLLCKAFIKAWQNRFFFDPITEKFYWWLCRQARVCYNECTVSGFRKYL